MTKITYLKTIIAIATLGFSITLALLIGDRLSTQAMAVLAGAVCGVSAAIPTSLLIITVSQRLSASQAGAHQPQPPQPHFTQPVVFTVPPMPIQPPTPTPTPATWDNVPAQRRFTVVGDLSADQAGPPAGARAGLSAEQQAGMGEQE